MLGKIIKRLKRPVREQRVIDRMITNPNVGADIEVVNVTKFSKKKREIDESNIEQINEFYNKDYNEDLSSLTKVNICSEEYKERILSFKLINTITNDVYHNDSLDLIYIFDDVTEELDMNFSNETVFIEGDVNADICFYSGRVIVNGDINGDIHISSNAELIVKNNINAECIKLEPSSSLDVDGSVKSDTMQIQDSELNISENVCSDITAEDSVITINSTENEIATIDDTKIDDKSKMVGSFELSNTSLYLNGDIIGKLNKTSYPSGIIEIQVNGDVYGKLIVANRYTKDYVSVHNVFGEVYAVGCDLIVNNIKGQLYVDKNAPDIEELSDLRINVRNKFNDISVKDTINFNEDFKPVNKDNGNEFTDWYIPTEEIIGESN